MNAKKLLIAAAGLALALGGVSAASAQDFAQTHPRRAEVNQRLNNQDARIQNAQATGAISPAKAARLHAADHRTRVRGRQYAANHNGHISRAEQRRLNHRETRTSQRIG
jgi:hypothetical protein